VIVLVTVAVAVIAGLLLRGDADTVAGVTPTPTATAQPTPSLSPAGQPPTGEPALQALAGASRGPFSATADNPDRTGSWIADVRTAGHSGYDRVVVEFDGDYVPTYTVGYTATSGPFHDVPGNEVPIDGEAFLDVWLQGTSSVDMHDSYRPVYVGPDRVAGDTTVVTEVVEVEDFEANVHWIIGLRTDARFVVWTMDSPSRLVIDIES
jgi:hypothetical protein